MSRAKHKGKRRRSHNKNIRMNWLLHGLLANDRTWEQPAATVELRTKAQPSSQRIDKNAWAAIKRLFGG